MCANLIGLKQINCGSIAINVEVPSAENVIFETVNGLVSAHNSRVKWIKVVKEASNCQGGLKFGFSFLLHFR